MNSDQSYATEKFPSSNPHGSVEDNPIDLSARIYLLNRAAHAESLAHTSVIAADRVPGTGRDPQSHTNRDPVGEITKHTV